MPVAGFATFVNALAVSGGTPAKTFNEYVAWVKQQGGKGSVGIPAPASTPEFLVKVVGEKYKLDLVAAPYRGSAPMMADMLGNQIPAGIASVQDFMENHKAGKLRVIGVLGTRRQATMPEVPTLAEQGVALESNSWQGLLAPGATPDALVQRINAAVVKALAEPAVVDAFARGGIVSQAGTAQQFAAFVTSEIAKYEAIIRRANITLG